MSAHMQSSVARWNPMLRAALGCWQDARGFDQHRALAGYMAQRMLSRAGFGADRERPRTIRLGGLELNLRPGSGELYLYQEIFRDRVYERASDFALQPGWCVIDCGANIGMFSLRAARAGCSQIFALEPDPATFACLALNLERNRAAAVTAVPLAAGRTVGRAAFHRAAISTLGHLVLRDAADEKTPQDIFVSVTTLAALVDHYALPAVQLLKLDVEGAEAEALEGARPVLDRIERIVMEFHSAERLAACEQLLAENGFARVALAPPAYAYFARRRVI